MIAPEMRQPEGSEVALSAAEKEIGVEQGIFLSEEGAYLLSRVRARCTDDAGCWVWDGTCQRGVMPMINLGGKVMAVRRAVFVAVHGEVKEGFEVVAGCETKRCVNPECLEQITMQARRRRLGKERNARPTSAAMIARNREMFAKLDLEKAREIRVSPEPSIVLAQRFGVSRTRINDIRAGKAWVEVSPFAGLGAR